MQADDSATLTPEAEAIGEDDGAHTADIPDPKAFFEIYWPYFEAWKDQA